MEKLVDIMIENAAGYILDVEHAIKSIHQHGIAVHDISPSNIMLNQQGCITIIGFGRAGYFGDTILPCKAIGVAPTTKVFSAHDDLLALAKTIRIYSSLTCT